MTAPASAGPGQQRGSRAGWAAQIIVIAKAPIPGRVKTRLIPPFSPQQAARLAEAALADTLAAVAQVPAARHVIALDGAPGPWLPAAFDVLRQRGQGLDERIAAAMGEAYARLPVPVVLIGMDTPQVTPELLASAIRPLVRGTADAAFGPADDGGYWLLGLRQPDPGLVTGVPMSGARTGAVQLARLYGAGLRVHRMRCCTDVDSAADAVAVAGEIPRSRFAAALREMLTEMLAAGPASLAAPADAPTDGSAAPPIALTWPVSSPRQPRRVHGAADLTALLPAGAQEPRWRPGVIGSTSWRGKADCGGAPPASARGWRLAALQCSGRCPRHGARQSPRCLSW